jgi:hypothetical protein
MIRKYAEIIILTALLVVIVVMYTYIPAVLLWTIILLNEFYKQTYGGEK